MFESNEKLVSRGFLPTLKSAGLLGHTRFRVAEDGLLARISIGACAPGSKPDPGELPLTGVFLLIVAWAQTHSVVHRSFTTEHSAVGA